MQCPRTGEELKKVKVGGVEVYVSQACGGVFLDSQSIVLFRRGDSKRGNALAKHISQFNSYLLDEDTRIDCPKCNNVVMMRRYYSPLKVIEIDECPMCAGIWLDTGELEKIQNIEASEIELARAKNEMRNQSRSNNHGCCNKQAKGKQVNYDNYLDHVFELISSIFE